MKKFGKSFLKGAKYVGLSLGAAAVGGVAANVAELGTFLIGAGVPETIAIVAAGYGVPVIGSFLAVSIQQIIRHRDEIFS